jgi:hypothetical protein
MIRDALDAAPPGEIRLLSLCAGDARDLTIAATGHPRAADLSGMLVELDPRLASDAAANITSLNERITVSNTDAGSTAAFRDAAPVDLLLLCGIFGNVPMDDIRNTIAVVPAMCRPGATVIWTRHRRAPDATPSIRQWFDEVGCVAVEFVSPGLGSFAIGRERTSDTPGAEPLPARLFTFHDDLW